MARVCVIRQYYLSRDPRARAQVDALASDGHQVDVICMRAPGESRREHSGNVTFYRLPLEHRRGGTLWYLMEYALFFLMAAAQCSYLFMRRRHQMIFVGSLPDSLVFATLIPRIFGARIMLDLRECMPEFFATKFGSGLGHPAVRVISRLEQASIRYAHGVITCTAQMRDTFVGRGANPDKIAVVMNSSDEAIFNVDRYPPQPGDPRTFTLICHGTIEERYGLDTVVRAVALAKNEVPGIRFRVFGDGSFRPALIKLAQDLSVEDSVVFSEGFVPIEELLQAIATADAGVVGTKRDIFRDLVHTLKMFDFIAMRKPTIITRTPAVEAYFEDSCFQYFESDNPKDLARAIKELASSSERRDELVRYATRTYQPYRWEVQREHFLSICHQLLSRKGLEQHHVQPMQPVSRTPSDAEGAAPVAADTVSD